MPVAMLLMPERLPILGLHQEEPLTLRCARHAETDTVLSDLPQDLRRRIAGHLKLFEPVGDHVAEAWDRLQLPELDFPDAGIC